MHLNNTKGTFFFSPFLPAKQLESKGKKATIIKEKATINSIRYTYFLCIFLSEQWWKLQISNIA